MEKKEEGTGRNKPKHSQQGVRRACPRAASGARSRSCRKARIKTTELNKKENNSNKTRERARERSVSQSTSIPTADMR